MRIPVGLLHIYGADLIRLPNAYYSMATLHRSMFLIKSGNKILPHWIISIPKVDVWGRRCCQGYGRHTGQPEIGDKHTKVRETSFMIECSQVSSFFREEPVAGQINMDRSKQRHVKACSWFQRVLFTTAVARGGFSLSQHGRLPWLDGERFSLSQRVSLLVVPKTSRVHLLLRSRRCCVCFLTRYLWRSSCWILLMVVASCGEQRTTPLLGN